MDERERRDPGGVRGLAGKYRPITTRPGPALGRFSNFSGQNGRDKPVPKRSKKPGHGPTLSREMVTNSYNFRDKVQPGGHPVPCVVPLKTVLKVRLLSYF